MTKITFLGRMACYAGAAILAASLGAGCGDDDGDDGGGTPDASAPDASAPDADMGTPVDAAVDATVDATPCQGHGCDDIDSPFQLAEGGEFRLERFQQGADDATDDLAGQAFFFKGQTGDGFRPLDGTPITLRQEILDQDITCSDFSAGNLFDNGASPEAQAVVDSRTYYDVGATVTLTNQDDSADVITLSKQDPGATDLSAGLTHPILYQTDAATDVTRNAVYIPEITTGSADYPQIDVKFGRSVTGEALHDETTGEGTPLLYMPSQFTVDTPTEADLFENGAGFIEGQDFEIKYTALDATPADWPTVIPFIGFLNADGKVEAYCFDNGADDGDFVVPYEVFDFISDEGSILFGRFTHMGWEYQQDFTRLDFLGVECKLAPYSVSAASGVN